MNFMSFFQKTTHDTLNNRLRWVTAKYVVYMFQNMRCSQSDLVNT